MSLLVRRDVEKLEEVKKLPSLPVFELIELGEEVDEGNLPEMEVESS